MIKLIMIIIIWQVQPYLSHVQLPLILRYLLPELHHPVSLPRQLRLGLVLPPPGELPLNIHELL